MRNEPLLDPRTRSIATLVVLAIVFLFFLIWGWARTTAPLPAADIGTTSTDVCTVRVFEAGDTLTPADVTVNVYNASGRSQLARQTLSALGQRGFAPGRVGDAPDDTQVDRAEIRAANPESAAAQLVRANIGDPVVVTADPEAIGISVYLGPNWDQPTGENAGTVTVNATEEVCGPTEAPLP